MKDIHFRKTVKRIIQEDPRYAEDAYDFINEALSYTSRKLKKDTVENYHISGSELLNGISEYAIEQFGPMAGDVLKNWGLDSPLAIGNVVFNMVNEKLLRAREEDSIEDFNVDMDFDEIFKKRFEASTGKKIDPPVIA
jgi:uncharacterized repeat protein (TIGR04138 family)